MNRRLSVSMSRRNAASDEKIVSRGRGRSRARCHCPTLEREGTDSVNQTVKHPQKAAKDVINRGRSASVPRRRARSQDEKSACRERGRSRIRRHCPILIHTKREGTDSVSQTVDYSQKAKRDVMTHRWSVSSIPQRMAITEDEKRTRRHCPTSIHTQERDGTDSVNQTVEHPQKAEGNVMNRGRSVSIRPRRPITDDKKIVSHQRGRSRTRHHCPTSIHTKERDGTDSQTVEPALTPTDSQTVKPPQKAGGDHMRKKQDLTLFKQKCNRMLKSERERLEDKRREIRKREILWRQRKLEVERRYLAKMEGLLEDMAWQVQALDLFTEKDGETKSGQSNKKNGQVPQVTGQYKAGDKKTRLESKAEKSRKGRIGNRERKRKGDKGDDEREKE